MANAAGWSTTDKHANVTISSISMPYNGANGVLTQSTNDGNSYGARTAWSASSGKWVAVCRTRYMSSGAHDAFNSFGIANGSQSLSNAVGGSVNSYGFNVDGLWYNNANLRTTGPYPGYAVYDTGSQYIIAMNLDSSPRRLYLRKIGASNVGDPRVDTGWMDITGAAADPTNSAQGTDIDSLGLPLYFYGSARLNNANPVILILNMGGWPELSSFNIVPSGYSQPDANYPYTMPVGTFTLSNNTDPTNFPTTLGNMRATTISSIGTGPMVTSSAYPSGGLTIEAVYWDNCFFTNNPLSIHGLCGTGAFSDLQGWSNSGGTFNASGVAGPVWTSGDTTYHAVNKSTQRHWLKVNSGSWFGNGGGSPDPATGTSGMDFSALASASIVAPAIAQGTDGRGGLTFNAGRLVDPVTLPAGFSWLDVNASPMRSRISMA